MSAATITPLEARCKVCQDTGSMSCWTGGNLDCTECDVAAGRAALNDQIMAATKAATAEYRLAQFDAAWFAYQLGKADAAPVAAQSTEAPRQTVDDVLLEMQPGGALYQPPSALTEQKIIQIAASMPVSPWGIGSRRCDAVAFAWEVLKATPTAAVSAAPSGEVEIEP